MNDPNKLPEREAQSKIVEISDEIDENHEHRKKKKKVILSYSRIFVFLRYFFELL
jgi:hypothetical protein